MAHPEADLPAYPLFSWTQSGNGQNPEANQTPRAASYEYEAQDLRAYSKPSRNIDENRKRMYLLNQSSNSLTLPTEYHDDEEQLRRLFRQGFKRFMYTVVLVACLFGTIFGFAKYDVMTTAEVRLYNSLLTGLSIALGISIGSSFKDIALNLRWWFLSLNQHAPGDLDEILECDSLRDVSRHAIRSVKTSEFSIASICIFWVLVNLAAQAGVAMLSLTISLGASNFPLPPIIGNVYFTDFSQGFSSILVDENLSASQYCAHIFGGLVEHAELTPNNSNDTENLPIQPFSLVQDGATNYWQSPTYFQYVFTEFPADSDSIIGLFYSNRSITVSSRCEVFPVIANSEDSSAPLNYVVNGTTQKIPFQTPNPASNASTTYYTSPNVQDCGPRCVTVYALENNETVSFYYKCHVSVSNVANATLSYHNITDPDARIAAGAIALQGFQAQDPSNQFQTFPSSQSIWGTGQNGNSTSMAQRISTYTIGVFVISDEILPDINATELHPGQGVTLSLDNRGGMIAILGTLLAFHFLLVVVGSLIANRVYVPEDSYLTVGSLLQPVLQKQKLQKRAKARGESLLGNDKTEEPSIEYREFMYGKGSDVQSGSRDRGYKSIRSWGFKYIS
ncbi:hypothetical protein N431DRAFT_441966 [Stipitochalara longipes BDJ]|nr:hypothetical protein N431DRAFT_441966 [Stipitochalara longipes BDJ]